MSCRTFRFVRTVASFTFGQKQGFEHVVFSCGFGSRVLLSTLTRNRHQSARSIGCRRSGARLASRRVALRVQVVALRVVIRPARWRAFCRALRRRLWGGPLYQLSSMDDIKLI